ncbi:hypothetical protein DMA12_03200 [Amycolatopsis balhimycina DSM 5908]|jgi:hypothetical protein|uniref:Uncharacterized protein n=1 Tax=Amycolatopsis balhimycina DSM 5908 TaxID=1081091 RepID=A0A428X4M4_AMYBA|nr:hypothetical protein [Amycolatopsis balhimycina]RSM50262.1 hypothetical protein DMA12_03200 [Amycolatopsis balhimycina DSM 5908]
MTVGRFTRVLRKVFFAAVALLSLALGGVVCLMCQVLAGRDAPTYRVEGHVTSHEQGALPVGGDEEAVSHTIAVDAGDRHYRVTAVDPGLDLPPGQPVTLDVSTADGSIAYLRAGGGVVDLRQGVIRPVLLITAALLALGAVYYGAVRLNVYPPVATWLALALGAVLAPVAVFVRV